MENQNPTKILPPSKEPPPEKWKKIPHYSGKTKTQDFQIAKNGLIGGILP